MATKDSRSEPGPPRRAAGNRTRPASADDVAAPSARVAAPRPKRVAAETYNAFIKEVDLVSVRLSGAEIRAGSPPQRKHLIPSISQTSGFVHQDEDVLVTHELTFSGKYEDEEEPAVFIRAEFEIRYSTPERMTDQIFAEFRKRNLPLNTWPYFREFVHAALARTGWPVLVLPVYKAVGAPLSPAE